MSRIRIPSFQSLLAFEAAGRHLSFKKAADELCLSPPAVTYRIKELEDQLGLSLFVRQSSGLQLTRAGEDYLVAVEHAIAELRLATERVVHTHHRKRLRVQMLPFMASELVIPALTDFQSLHPDIEIQIETTYDLADFQRDDIDVAIRYGDGQWEGIVAELVMPIALTPVCSPRYAEEHRIGSIDDLDGKVLIGMGGQERNWDSIAGLLQRPPFKPAKVLDFNDYILTLRAAESHAGVAFGLLPLIQLWLDTGRLVAPLDIRIPLPKAYYFVYREPDRDSPAINLFKNWLLSIFPHAD